MFHVIKSLLQPYFLQNIEQVANKLKFANRQHIDMAKSSVDSMRQIIQSSICSFSVFLDLWKSTNTTDEVHNNSFFNSSFGMVIYASNLSILIYFCYDNQRFI
jgi:hypothetical protein